MREFGTHEGSDILTRAYNTLEQGPLEIHRPCHPDDDAMVRWQRLRERSARPGNQVANSTLNSRTTAAAQSDAAWNEWVDEKIRSAQLVHNAAIAPAMGKYVAKHLDPLRAEIAALRRELVEARAEIKALQQQRSVEASIASWHTNARAFTVTPFDQSGRAIGTPIKLREMFREYQDQTS